jgi:hypothetical protein
MDKPHYTVQRSRLRKFLEWAGEDRDADGLTLSDMNRFVACRLASGQSIRYIRGVCMAQSPCPGRVTYIKTREVQQGA